MMPTRYLPLILAIITCLTVKGHAAPTPVHGGWSQWSSWIGRCSAIACNETGLQFRRRECTNPTPSFGGKQCGGQEFGARACINRDACPVDGQWGAWGDFGDCSATCGVSIRTRSRECNNPEPKNGGKLCSGQCVFPDICYLAPCPKTSDYTDDEDTEHEIPGSGAKSTTHPCDYFQSSYDYALCLDGLITPPPDVPGNEDVPANEDGPPGGEPNPLDYSQYSHDYGNPNDPNAIPEKEGVPTTHPCDYFQSSYDYDLCLNGLITPPLDVPGNKDVPANEDGPPGGEPNPLNYSQYSHDSS